MSTQKAPNMLRAALWYASKGVFVFPVHEVIFSEGKPTGCTCEAYRHSDQCKRDHEKLYLAPGEKCKNPGKCPRVRWAEKSTRDEETIKKWWGVWPSANIGVDCNKSGWLVFDADTYKQLADLSDLLDQEDRETVTVLTGGGGEHYIYDRQGKSYGNSTKGLPAGIDIRGVGGYVVAPPSLHKSGKRYTFEEGYELSKIPLLPIPLSLDRILSSCTASKQASEMSDPDSDSVERSRQIVTSLLDKNDLETFGEKPFGQLGRKWVLKHCPFNPEDSPHAEDASSFITINDAGAIAAGCHHNRCRAIINEFQSGWELLKVLLKPNLLVPVSVAEPEPEPVAVAEPEILPPDFVDYPVTIDFSASPMPTEIDKELERLASEELARKMKIQKEKDDQELLIKRRTEMFFRHAMGLK